VVEGGGEMAERAYPISLVKVHGVYAVAGRRYIVYDTMIDSFNNQPAIAIEGKDGAIRVKVLFVPAGQKLAARSSHAASHYLSDWRSIANADPPPVDGNDRPRLKFAEIPASGKVVIADDEGHEQTVAP
jgi:hypothetical protein